ncbi:hypothetical protein C8Q74DRAFT_1442370 [Fomes fomentarius]|nr:hypothetical protein C8Q74DRAFT_1442370 [Fomes fomentarius]
METDVWELRAIVMPTFTFTLTTKVMEALSRKEHLEVVQFEFMESQGGVEALDVADWTPVMGEGAFPALYMPPPQVHAFLTALAENCPQLAELAINYSGEPHGLVFLPNPPADMLLYSPGIPSAQLSTDLEDIASSWPELEVIILDCQPLPSTLPSALTLDALVPFARHCPRLRELGLYLSAATTTTTHPVPFKSLQRLDVGVSSIVDPGPAALFLSELCPSDCLLVSGVNWPHDESLIVAESGDDLDALRGVLADPDLGEFYRQ